MNPIRCEIPFPTIYSLLRVKFTVEKLSVGGGGGGAPPATSAFYSVKLCNYQRSLNYHYVHTKALANSAQQITEEFL